MKRVQMMKGARILVDTCASVRPSELVLIVTDTERVGIAEVLMSVCYEREAEATMAVMTPRRVDGEEPPRSIAEAMKTAQMIFMPVTCSITHTNASRAALQAGARVLSMTAFTEDQMISGGIEADFLAQRPICQEMANRLTAAKRAHLTSRGGTNLLMSLEGRKGNAHACLVSEAGQFSAVPNIEANTSPVEGTAGGVIVADASIPYLGIGVLHQPIRLTVKNGAVAEITGGEQASRLCEILRAQNHPSVYNIAQLAIGLNPKCTQITGVMLNDEGVFGTVHIGIGTSANIGGVVKAPTHFDLVMAHPTLELDGKVVLRDGELAL